LNGEYGLDDIYLGVPVVLGRNGIEKIVELQLLPDEKELLYESARSVKEVMVALDDMNLFEQKYGRLNPIPAK